MRFVSLLSLVSFLGCGSSQGPGVQPFASANNGARLVVSGTVEEIRFQNINKAQGHYTYNVDVIVAHDGIAGSPHPSEQQPGELRVRVHKVYWGRLDDTEKAQIAPNGPQQVMTLSAWRDYATGEVVELDVVSLGPGLAAPASR